MFLNERGRIITLELPRKDMFKTILDRMSAGMDTMMVTVVADMGSSPRSAGAHMLVGGEGRIRGTIGGGTLEYRAVQLAREFLESRKSLTKTYRLRPNGEEDLGMICGGDMELYFQYMKGGDEKLAALMVDILAHLKKDEDTWLFTDLSSPTKWAMTVYAADTPPRGIELSKDDIKALARNKGVLLKTGGRCLYGEPVNFAGKVFIFGGGHVAQALVPVLSTLGFRCVIFDNRKEFADRELFPTAYDVIAGDYENIYESIETGPNDYVVIVTHAYDLVVLRQVISRGHAYTGLIGSKGKVASVKQQLVAEGIPGETLDRLNAPIGLPIHSETPEEIAISIAGEMIQRRAERRGSHGI
ncbi:MAG: XdhC family protein [Treponema sp.]|jgi:xanthine dehydrogenase accessory factor|nr:XdhC family protein [Treponema sp.]